MYMYITHHKKCMKVDKTWSSSTVESTLLDLLHNLRRNGVGSHPLLFDEKRLLLRQHWIHCSVKDVS